MKREELLLIISLVLVVFASSFVAAQSLEVALDGFVDGFEGFLKFFIGDIEGGASTEIFLVKLLVFILLYAIISVAVRRFPAFEENGAVSTVISIVVALIAVRYLTTENLINFIWLPYGVLGIFLSAILPFIIAFFFIESFDSTIIRKVGWSAFTVIFGALAYLRFEDLVVGPAAWQNLAWVYAIIGILSLLLIVFDSKVRTMMVIGSIGRVEDRHKRVQVANVSREIKELTETLATAPDAAARRAVRAEIRSRKRTIREILKS